jgi:tetratricopeptide (TPR) repeat protein
MKALVAIALLASAAQVSLVSAEPVPEKARQLADRGRILHDAGDYVDAIAAFNEAYVLAPSPGLLFNLAQAYRLAGKCDDAAWMYRRFLDSHPGTDKRQLAEAHLATVEKCGHGGLRVAIIPQPPAMTATIPEPRIETAATTPTALAIHSRPIESNAGQRDKRIGIALGIGGGVILAGAAYFAWDAHEASNTVSTAYAQGKKWSDVASTDERGQHSATMGEALGIAGGLAVASGAVMYLIGRHQEHVAVMPTAGGAGIRMSWGF